LLLHFEKKMQKQTEIYSKYFFMGSC